MLRSYTLALLAILAMFYFPMLPSSIGGNAETLADPGPSSLLLNEISPWPSDSVVWVELVNPGPAPVSLEGWKIEFLSGFAYTFENDAGELTGEGFHVLSITGENPLNPDGDGCVLTGPDGVTDAISWGIPQTAYDYSAFSSPPLMPDAEVYHSDMGIYQPDDVLIRIPDTWPPNVENQSDSDNWAWRSADSASRGEQNPFPGPTGFFPSDGAVLASDFALYASGMIRTSSYSFKVASDPDFLNIVIEQTTGEPVLHVTDLDPGTYYWCVKGNYTRPNVWSPTQSFILEPFDIAAAIETLTGSASSTISPSSRLASGKGGQDIEMPEDFALMAGRTIKSFKVVGCSHRLQQRDTDILCLDGCEMDGTYPWDTPHIGMLPLAGGHNNKYCARATLAMIASLSGGNLSQDRISYYIHEELGLASTGARNSGHIGDPVGDLGHGFGLYMEDIRLALDWIYAAPAGSSTYLDAGPLAFFNPTPAPDSIREFIDAGRPVIRDETRHVNLIDAYVIVNNTTTQPQTEDVYVRILEPSYNGADAVTWQKYPVTENLLGYIFPPIAGSPVRTDESDIALDSDQDGLNDFDEKIRFHTDPNSDDTDGDGVKDKQDIIGYVYWQDGTWDLQERDIDGDGVPKELDPDNDQPSDNGVSDGCEDVNHDGFFSQGPDESDCFNASDDFTVLSPDCFRGIFRDEYIYDVPVEGGRIYFNWIETIIIEDGQPLDSDEFLHEHRWELVLELTNDDGFVASDYDSGTHLAKGKLVCDPDDPTGECIFVTDIDPRETSYDIDVTAPYLFAPIQIFIPTQYVLAGNLEWPIGVPTEAPGGGTVIKGTWEPFQEAGLPPESGCTQVITWEFLIDSAEN